MALFAWEETFFFDDASEERGLKGHDSNWETEG
jgi:hypothetical protein